MSYKRGLLIFSITIISIALVYFLILMEQSATKETVASRPVALPYNWIGNITQTQIAEPSGITYHPTRRSLFLAVDSGSVHEVSLEGRLIQSKGLNERDIEGITVDPSTGLLYAAVEGDEVILELEPEHLAIQREFRIGRDFKGEQLLRKGGMGIEAIAFVPDASHPRVVLFGSATNPSVSKRKMSLRSYAKSLCLSVPQQRNRQTARSSTLTK